MKHILALCLWLASATLALAQGCGPTNPNCVVPTAPPGTSDNRAASTAFVQNALFGGGGGGIGPIINLQPATGIPVIDVTALRANMFGASGSGALFSTCPLTYSPPGCMVSGGGLAVTYAAQYLKATASTDSTIAEYMVINDCNLNAGRGATASLFNDAKVCQYNSAVTGSNAGNATWVQANNLVIGAGDNVPPGPGLTPFKVNTELDVTNNGPDCAVGVRNCYNLYLSGNVANPTTAFVAIAPTGTTTNSHYGILINGNHTADSADIEIDGSAAAGICIGCLSLGSGHSTAAFWDQTNSGTGLFLSGTYTNFSISAPNFNVTPGGYMNAFGATFIGTPPTTTSGRIGYGGATVTAGSATCPAGTVGGQTIAGCVLINVGGTNRYMPFF